MDVDSIFNLFDGVCPSKMKMSHTMLPCNDFHVINYKEANLKDPVFGPIINFGAGGSLVEVMQDRALALPPLN